MEALNSLSPGIDATEKGSAEGIRPGRVGRVALAFHD